MDFADVFRAEFILKALPAEALTHIDLLIMFINIKTNMIVSYSVLRDFFFINVIFDAPPQRLVGF